MEKVLRASKAGFPCERNLWYSTNGFKGIVSSRTQKIFDTGTCLEPLVVEWLRQDGWEVKYNQGSQNADLEFIIPLHGGIIAGHPDAFISRPGCENVLVDIKTMNERAWIQWKREGSIKSKPQYVDQIHIYAMGAIWANYKVDKLGIVGLNKNTSAIHIDFFDFDPKRFEEIQKRAMRIFEFEEAPSKNSPSEKWCCGYCEYAHLCELNATKEKDTAVGDDTAVTSDEDVINAMQLLKEARELSKAGEELEGEAKTVLDEKIRQRGIKSVKAGNLILSLSERTSNRFSSTAFKAAHPDMYQEFVKPSTSVTYNLKEAI